MKVYALAISIIFLLVVCYNSQAQLVPPHVDDNIEVAGIKLKLSKRLQHEIQEEVNRLMRSQTFFKSKVDLANLYLPIVSQVFKEQEIPDDLKYLCIQESGLVSDAVSSSKAVGFWQFKFVTGKEVGLRIDKHVDERMNIQASSVGAAKYFKRSHFMFKNWIYSVLGHYTGAYGAKKYVKQEYIGADKMSVDHNLFWYVKRFIAHKIAFEGYVTGKHSKGLRLLELKDEAGKSLPKIARERGVELELLSAYNKWLRNGSVPDDKVYTVLVPTKAKRLKPVVATKNRNIDKKPTKTEGGMPEVLRKKDGNPHVYIKLNKLRAVIAKQDDNLDSLAKKTNIPVPYLMKFNDIDDGGELLGGRVYYLRRKRSKAKVRFHKVMEEDNLWSISQKYGLRLKNLKKLNRMSAGQEPAAGQLLSLRKKRKADDILKLRPDREVAKQKPIEPLSPFTPVAEVSKVSDNVGDQPSKDSIVIQPTIVATPDSTQVSESVVSPEDSAKEVIVLEVEEGPVAKFHYVEKGETMYALSRRFGVDVEDIYMINNFQGAEVLNIGQRILLPDEAVDGGRQVISLDQGNIEEEENTYEKEEEPVVIKDVHIVKSGESLWGIAKKRNISLDELKVINGLSDNNIHEGQVLKLSSPQVEEEEEQVLVEDAPNSVTTHEVQQGDTFYSIANQYNISVKKLQELNQKEDFSLSTGEKIIVAE